LRKFCGSLYEGKASGRVRMIDPCLTQKIQVSLPVWRNYSQAPDISGYTQITSLTPIIKELLGQLPSSEGQLNADELFGRVLDFEERGSCSIVTVNKKKRKAFCKVTHLLDPIRSIQGYYIDSVKGEQRKHVKLSNPMNQAYIDALGNYLLGQLRERKISPHFCLFYGGFQGVAKKYNFNITDEFESYRNYKGFWEKRKRGYFELCIESYEIPEEEEDNGDMKIEEIEVNTPNSDELHSESFSYTTPRSNHSTRSACIDLGEVECDMENLPEIESLHSEDSVSVKEGDLPDTVQEVRLRTVEGGEGSSESSSSDSTSSSEESSEDGIQVYAQFKDYPVMLIFQEEMKGVLDDLLDDEEEVGAEKGTQEWEDRWIAWTFQVIAALSVAQGVLGFTHNDLHTNNIVWCDTDESWFFYKTRDGTHWKVPTYGKILRIIDFGRAIFRIDDRWFVSDDYAVGGDAEGQYSFEGHRSARMKTTVEPNPSFDLCRYAVSVLESLFDDEMPPEKLDGEVISREGNWVIHETESPLWNLLWSWLIDDEGRNVLKDEDGTERFPDFDLYKHISTHVFGAKPQEQLRRKIFDSYLVKAVDVGDWETVYPLFC
jgi:hypothetical protein